MRLPVNKVKRQCCRLAKYSPLLTAWYGNCRRTAPFASRCASVYYRRRDVGFISLPHRVFRLSLKVTAGGVPRTHFVLRVYENFVELKRKFVERLSDSFCEKTQQVFSKKGDLLNVLISFCWRYSVNFSVFVHF